MTARTREQQPRTCRRCGAPVLLAHELDERVRVPDALVDAQPLPVTAPLDGSLWEHHPRAGWVAIWPPVRRGYPIHRAHQCAASRKQEAHV